MENQYGQALNTHARFNAYASSPSIETSERIHNRRQAKLNYLCSHTHTQTRAHIQTHIHWQTHARSMYSIHSTKLHTSNKHTCIHTNMLLTVDWQMTWVRVREQLRGKQKQKKPSKKPVIH